MSEQLTVDAELQVTEPIVPPPPPPSAADVPPLVAHGSPVAPVVTAVDDSAVDHSWLNELETVAPSGAATAPGVAAAAAAEPRRRSGFFARVFARRPKVSKRRKAEAPASVDPVEVPSRPKATNPWLLRGVGIVGVVGILALGYLQYGQKHLPALDLLGTSLPDAGQIAPQPAFDVSEFDPRLADTSPLPLAPLEEAPVAPISGASEGIADAHSSALQPDFDPEAVMRQSAVDAGVANLPEVGAVSEVVANVAPQRSMPSVATPSSAAVMTAATASASPVAPTAVAGAAPMTGDPQMLERMKRMEDMILLMSQQLAAMQQANAMGGRPTTATAAAPAPAAGPAAAQAAPAEQPSPRPTPKRAMVKTSTPRQPAKVVAAKPAAKEAAPTRAQLVSVDMWNGEPSVVVASGVPGDRRVRVLRPGDVVNGLSLKSADPVARTATFVAPGSQGLTLSVTNGG